MTTFLARHINRRSGEESGASESREVPFYVIVDDDELACEPDPQNFLPKTSKVSNVYSRKGIFSMDLSFARMKDARFVVSFCSGEPIAFLVSLTYAKSSFHSSFMLND
jgi:hypothetical protein